MHYIYIYLDTRKPGKYSYENYKFEYEPFYVGKGTKDRYLTHLRIAKGLRKGKNNILISKIKSILNDGQEPLILKIEDNLNESNYSNREIYFINLIGKLSDNKGPLLNITNGGDGGITWIDEHHNKGKRLEQIVGEEKALYLRKKISDIAKLRVGEKNPNYGKKGDESPIKGEKNPNYGKERKKDVREKISNTLKKYYDNMSTEEKNLRILKQKDSINKIPKEIKEEWYKKISTTLKEKKEKGEIFTEEHRNKLVENNWKKKNKGTDSVKISEETKRKISKKLKGRVLTEEHKDKLKKCIPFEEFETIIKNLVNNNIITSITKYRNYARQNPHLKCPIRPEISYLNYGWEGWRKYGL